MAMSSSFASRLVIRIAPALLLSFVFSIPNSYATRIHHPPYDGPPIFAVPDVVERVSLSGQVNAFAVSATLRF